MMSNMRHKDFVLNLAEMTRNISFQRISGKLLSSFL